MSRDLVPACPPHLAEKFVGVPTAMTLSPTHRLYKLVSIPIDRQRILQSPWWIPETEFDRCRQISFAQRRPLSTVVREQFAIAPKWNPGMDGLCILWLARPKLGWIGMTKPQPKVGDDLVGWGVQAAVPDLDWRDVAQTRMQVPFYQSGNDRPIPLHQ